MNKKKFSQLSTRVQTKEKRLPTNQTGLSSRQAGFSLGLIIILITIIIVLAVGGFFAYKYFFKEEMNRLIYNQDIGKQQAAGEDRPFGQKPGAKQEQAYQANEAIPQPPSGQVSVYKGFWLPCGFYYDYKCQSMSDPKDLKAVGANIASIAPNVKINSRGEVKFDTPFDYVEQSLAYWVKNYYDNDIRISLVIELTYQEEFKDGPTGEPQPIPRNIASRPGFLTNYNEIVDRIAKLAEKYKVEIFSPMNEPDLKLGEETADKWAQEILPVVKENYSGKVLWKAAGGALDKYDTDFKGYDIIGFDPTPGGGSFEQSLAIYRQALNSILYIAQNRAARDKVPEIMITEFGVWGEAISFTEEQKALTHRAVFEIAPGKVSGFFALDPPPDLDRGLKGTLTLEEIKKWFKKL